MCESSNAICCSPKGMRAWATTLLLLAIGCFTVAIFVPPAINSAVDDGINDFVIIDAQAQADNNKYYRTFTDPDDPDSTAVYYSVYLFNLKNPTEVATTAARPNYEEKGPYVYRKKIYKRNTVFGADVYGRATVSYQTQTQYIYDSSRSPSTVSEGDLITNVNLPFQTTKGASHGTLYAAYAAYGPLADRYRYFTTQNVSAWLWGWPDQVLATIHSFYPCCTVSAFPGVLGPNENELNPLQPQDTLFVGSKPDQSLVRQYIKYEGMDSLQTLTFTPPSTITYPPTWASGLANRVFGTDGTQFARGLDQNAVVNAYVSQLTRTVTLGNVGGEKVTFKNIDMLHFTLPDIYLGNATEYPFNGDFYMFGYRGMANLTATGLPDFYVSKPHFLDADPALIGSIDGITVGNTADHDTYLNVEPISGATMQAAKRLQLSVRLTSEIAIVPNSSTPPIGYTPQVWGGGLPNPGGMGQYMPIYWAEEYGEVSDSSADDFVAGVYGGQKASMGIYIAGEAAACALVVAAVIMYWVAAAKDQSAGGSTPL